MQEKSQERLDFLPDDLRELARLDSPDFYAANPYPVFDRLRREAPVFWYESGRFWAITRHADITTVENDPTTFVSGRGTRLADHKGVSGLVRGADPLFPTDPPDHTIYRRMVSSAFTPRRVAALEPTIRELVRELLDSVPDEPVDFVETVAEPLPIYVIGMMLGLPRSDWGQLKRWSDVRVRLLDATAGTAEQQQLYAELEEYYSYLETLLETRRTDPGGLISMIAAQEELSLPNQMQMINSLAVAGNETTRSALSCAATALANCPGEWEKLAADPARVSQTATEEVLRWGTPIVHFGRTAAADTTLAGEHIAKDDFVMMLYPSANRDELVWDNPYTFDVTRQPRSHLSFGSGTHFCLGAGLARLEIKVALEELVRYFHSWQPAGKTERLMSVHVNQYTAVPVTATRR